ncbi:MAG: hypothetical protein KatS3mg057_0831 [Herpetosiphonaceae bacterium]|nr:MAG: hypothetical protein KatS3mg057_0831 [Herpetosiphonaceae bacterium]
MPRLRLTFAWRLALTSLLVTVLGMLLLATALLLLVGRYEAERRTSELLADAEVEAAYLSELAALSDLHAAAGVLVERFASSSVRAGDQVIRIFGLGGELIASSSPSVGYFPSRAAAALIPSPLPALADEERRRYVAQPVTLGGNTIAVIELSHSRGEERELLALIGRVLARATLLALVATLIGSVVLGRLTGRRVEGLRRVAEGIAGGDLGLRARESGAYELAQLARSLNTMADQLQERLQQLQAAAERERRFYRDVAHELRTPLTALQGYLEQIEDTASAEQQSVVESFKGELERLSRLAGELSHPGAPTPLARVPVESRRAGCRCLCSASGSCGAGWDFALYFCGGGCSAGHRRPRSAETGAVESS